MEKENEISEEKETKLEEKQEEIARERFMQNVLGRKVDAEKVEEKPKKGKKKNDNS